MWRDLRLKYAGSAGGWFWALVFPAAMMGTYFFIFSFFLKIQVPYAPGPTGYFLYLMSALIPWGATAEALTRSTTIFFEQSSLVQKVAFPLDVLPVYIALVALFQALVGMVLFTVVAAFIKGLSLVCVLLIPFVILIQFIFTLGLTLAFSAVSVFVRDMVQGVPVFLQIWFFASPILYPETMIPDGLKWLISVNPLSLLAVIYHGLFLQDKVMGWQIGLFCVWALGLWWIGAAVFYFLKDSISDLV